MSQYQISIGKLNINTTASTLTQAIKQVMDYKCIPFGAITKAVRTKKYW